MRKIILLDEDDFYSINDLDDFPTNFDTDEEIENENNLFDDADLTNDDYEKIYNLNNKEDLQSCDACNS
jgi:hypothetical protein